MDSPKFLLLLGLALLPGPGLRAASLEALPEYLRPDPFGAIVEADRGAASKRTLDLRGARGGYVSFHLVAQVPETGPYSFSLRLADPSGKLQVDVYREWFHLLSGRNRYYPDALVPVKLPYSAQMPDAENRIPKQTAQAFWVDIWIPNDAAPGSYRGSGTLEAGGSKVDRPFEVHVLSAAIPSEDVVDIDHNSYGSSWLADQYPKLSGASGSAFFESDAFFRLIHSYHRIFYEHRGIFHQLGYGHAGKVGPEFAPALEGSGRRKHIANWNLYDRHYGPLFDGSAFANTRRGAKPIPFVYLPINPEWPASYLWWGEPGYEAEFTNVVSEMEKHFREKGWTKTKFEMFFNHKKRYRGFSWDGDEVRFRKDNAYFREYGRLLKKAVPAGSPVQFRFRSDSSWDMENQFQSLAGVVDFWVANGSILSWYPQAPAPLRKRGDIIWFYSGPPGVARPADAIARFPFQAWMWGLDGYIHWLTVSAGSDPWFRFDGGGTALVYPGERFGIEAPIPSIRLKIQRNCVQDLDLLEGLKKTRPLESLKTEAAARYNQSKPAEWWNPRPRLADLPPEEWDGPGIDEATRLTDRMLERIAAGSWHNVHEFVISALAEDK